MVVAVSILLQKETSRILINRLRTYVYQGCNSQAEALGLASSEAINEDLKDSSKQIEIFPEMVESIRPDGFLPGSEKYPVWKCRTLSCDIFWVLERDYNLLSGR